LLFVAHDHDLSRTRLNRTIPGMQLFQRHHSTRHPFHRQAPHTPPTAHRPLHRRPPSIHTPPPSGPSPGAPCHGAASEDCPGARGRAAGAT
jgi:hypothetical protein